MSQVLYQVYNHRARGRCDYKPDIAGVGMTYFMSIQLNEATNHTVHCWKLVESATLKYKNLIINNNYYKFHRLVC